MKKILSLFTVIILSFFLFSCSNVENEDNAKIKIVSSLFPQYDFARIIAGDKAEVSLLLPYGAESHTFDPSMQDIVEISNADLFIFTGENMEPWTSSFVENLSEDCVVLDVSNEISKMTIKHTHNENAEKSNDTHTENIDPHIWTSPKNAKLIALSILTQLSNMDSENADYYTENFTKFASQLDYLHENIKSVVEQAQNKKIYFGGKFALLYFVEEYGIPYMSLYDSCAEMTEPSAKKLTEMITEMKKNEVKVIFYPELSDPKAANSIAEKVGATPLLFHSCHNLSAEDAKAGKTYLSIMYENLENLKEALK